MYRFTHYAFHDATWQGERLRGLEPVLREEVLGEEPAPRARVLALPAPGYPLRADFHLAGAHKHGETVMIAV